LGLKEQLKKFSPFLGIFIFTALLFLPVLLGRGAVFKDQSYEFHFQALEFVKTSLEQGDFPLWCPNTAFGYPFAAYPEFSLFYPLFLPIGLALSSVTAICLIVMVHYFLMAGFTYLYGRSLSLGKTGAITAGLAFAFNGFILERYTEIQSLGAIAFLPLILYFIEKSISQRSWKQVIFAGLALGVSFLAGGAQYSYYVVFFLCAYIFLRYSGPDWQSPAPTRLVRGIIVLAVMGLIGVGIFAVQLLPTAELAGKTSRSNLELSSFEPSHAKAPKPDHLFSGSSIKGLLFPYLPGKTVVKAKAIHPGILVLIFALWTCFFYRKSITIFYLILAAATFLLAAGPLTPIFPLLYNLPIPGFSMFKNPVRMAMPGVFALSILAGFGVDNLIKEGLGHRRRRLIFRLLILFFLATLFFIAMPWLSGKVSQPGALICALALAVLILFLALLGELSRKNNFDPPWSRFALVVLTGANLLLAAPILDFLPMKDVRERTSPTARAGFLLEQQGRFRVFSIEPADVFDYYNSKELVENLGLAQGLELGDGNSSLHLERYLLFTHGARPVHPRQQYAYDHWLMSPALADMAGLGYLVTNPNNHLSLEFLQEVYRDRYAKIYATRFEDSLLRFVPAARVVTTAKEAILPFALGTESPDNVVYLEKEPMAFFGRPNNSVKKTRILSQSPDRVVAEIFAPVDGLALLAHTFYNGWEGKVDGEPAPIYVANGLFRVIPIKAGGHKIEYVYKPKVFILGALISIITLAGAILMVVFMGKSRE